MGPQPSSLLNESIEFLSPPSLWCFRILQWAVLCCGRENVAQISSERGKTCTCTSLRSPICQVKLNFANKYRMCTNFSWEKKGKGPNSNTEKLDEQERELMRKEWLNVRNRWGENEREMTSVQDVEWEGGRRWPGNMMGGWMRGWTGEVGGWDEEGFVPSGRSLRWQEEAAKFCPVLIPTTPLKSPACPWGWEEGDAADAVSSGPR